MPPIFEWLQRHGGIDDAEMHRVFNCGIGLVVIVGDADAAMAQSMLVAAGETVHRIGEIVERPAGAAATIVV
jgi:phosphoribosylformylglycinamidine cyclo-ligase